MLHQRLAEVELLHEMAQPIPTLRVRTCSHPECGARKPRSLPADVMLIYLGCKYAVPGRERPTTDQHPLDGSSAGEQGSD